MKKSMLLLMIVAFVLMSAPAMAQPVPPVVTKAEITGAGGDPYVLVKWEGPDMDAGSPGIQIVPNPAGPLPGQGGKTQIDVWAVVSDPNGIADLSDVFFDIYHPDGTFKLQIHMQPVPCEEAVELFGEAWSMGWIQPCDGCPWTLEEIAWMLDCNKLQAQLWHGVWEYEIHQMDGWYNTCVTAVDSDGGTGSCCNADTEIISIVQLGLDFSEVNWGQIKPSVPKWVAGDDIFSPGDGKPTVWNQGNNLASLRVHNSALVGSQWGKLITDFDVRLLGQTENYVASEWVTLFGPLIPCTPVQIEFSVHAPYGTPKDTYMGEIDLEIIHEVL